MTGSSKETLSGWGRIPGPGREVRSEDLVGLSRDAVLVRGLGRSYGDSSLPPAGHPVVAGSSLADRVLAFDPATGVLRAEAGFTLFEMNRIFWPRGFCAPVAPGTQFITLGGMVAADVHGKNHHSHGSFGGHVLSLKLRVAGGTILQCSRDVEQELFRATIGGMGLTGHILEVECRLMRIPSPWIWCESERIHDLDRFIESLKEAGKAWPYTVGWIDCLTRGSSLGRGILQRGRWAEAGESPPQPPPRLRRPSVPFVFPGWVIDRWSIRAFNSIYYRSHMSRVKRRIMHPESFFYPLDFLREWNRLYGPRGFTQYQCIVPDSAGHGAARRFLELLTRRGGASMLCVIKDCGAEGEGILSFPKPGISIAFDIPVRDDTQALVDALNELVIAEGGRVYLAKDRFTRPEHFRAMEPRLDEFLRIRRKWDPKGRVRSAQSVRLFGDRP